MRRGTSDQVRTAECGHHQWGSRQMSGSLRTLWEEQPTNPDMESDLGYRFDPLVTIDGIEHGGQYIVLPAEEEQLHNDEFMITDEEGIVSLSERR